MASVNGWYSKFRADGTVYSGNAGIWRTPPDGPAVQVSPVGIGPIVAGSTLVFNRNDGTTEVRLGDPPIILPHAYNIYAGSDTGQWAGWDSTGLGRIDRYALDVSNKPHCVLLEQIHGACVPQFMGASFGYLTPFQTAPDNQRVLIVDGVVRARGVIVEWFGNRGGGFFVYFTVGPDGKQIFDSAGNNITIRPQADEAPLVTFIGPDGYPWMLSGTPSGDFVRMLYQDHGYVIHGDLFYPDARMIGDKLHVVGSLANGEPRSVWIDFTAPKVDLRTV